MWDGAYAPNVVADSRKVREPWLAGHVHVVSGLTAHPDPFPTDGLAYHRVIVPTAPHLLTEWTDGGAPYFDGMVRPNDTWVYSLALHREKRWSSWTAGAGFTSVSILPSTVASAAETMGLDYDALEFRDGFGGADPLLNEITSQLGRELEADAPRGRIYAEEMIQAAAVHLVRHHTTATVHRLSPRGGVTTRVVREVGEYVAAHLGDNLSLADLAAVAGLSAYHFSREYKRTTGEAPFEMVRRVRIERAAVLLGSTKTAIGRVALEVGYGSPSRFAATFRRCYGVSPSVYRRSRR